TPAFLSELELLSFGGKKIHFRAGGHPLAVRPGGLYIAQRRPGLPVGNTVTRQAPNGCFRNEHRGRRPGHTCQTMNEAAFLEFSHVRKTYDQKSLVVDDFNLAVNKGEFITLLGPSGSGKTTVLMMLAGFEHVTSGRITVDGQPITRIAPHKRNIGMVFQNYALFPHMTVAQNLAYPLKVRRVPAAQIRQRVAEFLKLIELEPFGDRHPGQLSGGQRQRVALARALIFEPSLVLMDEPLGALDKKLREQMQFEITRLHRKLGFTVIYVTH